MINYSTDDAESANPFTTEPEGIIPSGYFTDAELRAFSLLIDCRRSLPLYFGDCWRCYLCTFECFDFFDMVDHILKAHGPEPFNEADRTDMEERDYVEPD
jgi:hypothetical protein